MRLPAGLLGELGVGACVEDIAGELLGTADADKRLLLVGGAGSQLT
jgi:hypothetical protein